MLDLLGSFWLALQMKLCGPLHGLGSTLTDLKNFADLKPFHFCFPVPQISWIFFTSLPYYGSIHINIYIYINLSIYKK